MPKRIGDLKKCIPNFLRSSSTEQQQQQQQQLPPPPPSPHAAEDVFVVESPKSLQSLTISDNEPVLQYRLPTTPKSHEIPDELTVAASVEVLPITKSTIVYCASEGSLDTAVSTGHQPASTVSVMSAKPDLHKRVWVKRQGASATLIQITEDDLVDDIREKILRKYANSLGKSFDSPDVTLRIIPRADSHGDFERSLGPEEPVAALLSQYFPAGQTIEEALIIDIPHRRTPRQSPRVYVDHHNRPGEDGGDYFSVMPVALTRPSHMSTATAVSTLSQPPSHAISVLNTGQIPNVPLPSPGAASRRHASHRPKYGRTATASPTVLTTNGAHINSHTDRVPATPGITSIPTPPISTVTIPKATTPPSRAASPRSTKTVRPKKPKKQATGSQPPSLLDGGVPPISVLIVEDNIINLRLLEAFMKRLKVRWQTAMNGRDAVAKWRTGGFHLVLMDIQLPIMNGLEATREIRRLERVNSIGVLSARAEDMTDPTDKSEKADESDKLQNMDQFKSPVIVVALTASSLQSDRHEALAAGCNDFLTKPVNFVWMERKVMEWGCMQALIDFDGWRKWKDFAQPARATTRSTRATTSNTISATAGGSSGTPKVNRVGKASHSSSSASNDTSSSSKPAIPKTLVALNDKVESGDTIGSTDSPNSDDSIETLDLKSSRRTPTMPQLATFSSIGSTDSVSTMMTSRNSISRQSSSQSTHTVVGRDSLSNSPVRAAIHTPSIGSVVSAGQEESRRRKRSSFGRSGLSGVSEEVEGVGAV